MPGSFAAGYAVRSAILEVKSCQIALLTILNFHTLYVIFICRMPPLLVFAVFLQILLHEERIQAFEGF
jgi:hypothetical protein